MVRSGQPSSYPILFSFQHEGHNFNHLIQQLNKTENISEVTNIHQNRKCYQRDLKTFLKEREDFWILKLYTLTLKGLKQRLQKI